MLQWGRLTDVRARVPAGVSGTRRRRGGDRQGGCRGRDCRAHIAPVEEVVGTVCVVDDTPLDGIGVQDAVGARRIVRKAQASRVGVAEGVAGRLGGRQWVAVEADIHAGAPASIRTHILREACAREEGGHGRDVLEQHLDARFVAAAGNLAGGKDWLVVGRSRKAHTTGTAGGVDIASDRGQLV